MMKCASDAKFLRQATARTNERATKVWSTSGRRFPQARKPEETIMIDRSKLARESGMTYPRVLAVAGFAIFAVVVTGAFTMRMQAIAAPSASTERAVTVDSPTVYFPAQYVNQATEIEPLPPTF
jgi:hypothetical protein